MILVLDTICHEFGFSNNWKGLLLTSTTVYEFAMLRAATHQHLFTSPLRLKRTHPLPPRRTATSLRGSTPSGAAASGDPPIELPTPTMTMTRAAASRSIESILRKQAATRRRARLHLACCLVSFRTEHARKPCTPAGMHCILFIQLHPYSSSYLYIHLPSIIVMQRRSTQWLWFRRATWAKKESCMYEILRYKRILYVWSTKWNLFAKSFHRWVHLFATNLMMVIKRWLAIVTIL